MLKQSPQQTLFNTNKANNTPSQPFATRVLAWFDQHGRKDLPWQQNITPYRVWISEIMLQQTQVATVIPYYQKFIKAFPDVMSLANAEQDEVLKHWSGLGYYARARNLHKAAQTIRDVYAGEFPEKLEQVMELAGIGRSTAGAILSIACQQSHAILDGNVKRVLARYYAIEGWTGNSKVQKQLWQYAESLLPDASLQRTADYTQAMMDLGATVCTRSKPNCEQCPLHADCKALQLGAVDRYPQPKKKKPLPEKSAVMLIIQNTQAEVLLQKRPATGIWGGLWSFPQFKQQEDAEIWLQEQYNIGLDFAKKLPKLKHTFSHFHLTIQPILLSIEIDQKGIMEAGSQLWYNTDTEFNGGLAAPMTTLLNLIKKGINHDKNG